MISVWPKALTVAARMMVRQRNKVLMDFRGSLFLLIRDITRYFEAKVKKNVMCRDIKPKLKYIL